LYKFLSTASPALNTRQLYIHINNGQGVFTITVTIFSYCFTGPVFQTRSTPIHARTADKTIRNFYFPSLCLSLSPHFNGYFPGGLGLTGTRRSVDFNGAKDDGGGGDNWSY